LSHLPGCLLVPRESSLKVHQPIKNIWISSEAKKNPLTMLTLLKVYFYFKLWFFWGDIRYKIFLKSIKIFKSKNVTLIELFHHYR
jgi:hypothetical protein